MRSCTGVFSEFLQEPGSSFLSIKTGRNRPVFFYGEELARVLNKN